MQATATANAARQLWFLDTLVTVRAAHDDGQDGVSLIESSAAYGDSPPLHVHHTEDEVFHVLEGVLRLQARDREISLRAGQTLLAARGIPHTYRVESPDGARWLIVTTHGDFERFVRAVSRPAERSELPARLARPPPSRPRRSPRVPASTGSSSSGPR